jgi:hypothetical protein
MLRPLHAPTPVGAINQARKLSARRRAVGEPRVCPCGVIFLPGFNRYPYCCGTCRERYGMSSDGRR